MTGDIRMPATAQIRKHYRAPELVVHGSMEKLTGWVGGPWGEFFGGTDTGWNPWAGDGPWAATGS